MKSLSFLIFIFASSIAIADDIASQQQQLQQVQKQIQSLKSQLDKQQNKQSQAAAELEKSERAIAQNRRDIAKLNQDIANQEARLTVLDRQSAAQQKTVNAQQQNIEAIIASTWIQSQQPKLKLLIEQPNDSRRLMTYFDYFSDAQLSQLQQWQADLEELAITKEQAKQTLSTLEQNKLKLVSAQQNLSALKQTRSQQLSKVKQQVASTEEQIAKQLAQQQQLNNLIARLQQIEIERAKEQIPFANNQGKLNWPLTGRILQRFGDKLSEGRISSQGVVIQAKVQQSIEPVHPGTVIFSGFMRGLGNLVVLDHGDGYMSLYSRTEANLVVEGERVQKGDVIAIAGNSGGQDTTSLYLEIRHNGQAVNPLKWLK